MMTIENRDNLGLTDGQVVFGMRLQSLAKASASCGVVDDQVSSTGLKVSQRAAGANMSVDAAIGSCLIDGVEYSEAAAVNVVISAAHATDERIDLIVYDQSAGTPAVVTGTAHATDPQVPDVADDKDIPLAAVYVLPQDDPTYTGTITDTYIYDLRSFVRLGEAVVGVLELPIKQSTDDTFGSCFLNSTANTYVSAGKTKVSALPTGATHFRYRACIMGVWGASPSTKTVLTKIDNETTSTITASLDEYDTDNEPQYLADSMRALNISAGDVLNLKIAPGTDVAAYIFRAYLEFYRILT